MSKRVKSYKDFLKFRLNESEETKVSIEDKVWKYEFEDFIDYVNDFKDAEWNVEFSKEIYRNEYVNTGYWGNENWQYRDYVTDILSTGKQTPAYCLSISKGDDGQDVDLTDALKFLKGIVEDELNLECILMNDTSNFWFDVVELDKIRIENGSILIIKDDLNEKNFNGDEELEFLNVVFVSKEDVSVTAIDICEYYDWEYTISDDEAHGENLVKIIDGMMYVRKDQDDLTYVASNNRDYNSTELLITGIEDSHNWEGNIDTDSLIRYHLNDEAIEFLVKKIIKDTGGLEQFLAEYSDEIDLDLEGVSEDDVEDKVVEFLSEERFNSSLVEICKNEDEIIDEIRRDYDSWEAQARIDKFENKLQNEFDEILSNSFSFEKDEYKTEWKGGNGKWYHMYRYWIMIESKFIDDLFIKDEWDKSDFERCGVTALPAEWFERNGETETLDTRDPEYGDVDKDEFSSEVIAQYLS